MYYDSVYIFVGGFRVGVGRCVNGGDNTKVAIVTKRVHRLRSRVKRHKQSLCICIVVFNRGYNNVSPILSQCLHK